MKLVRTFVILTAVIITMLFVWQANSPAFAKDNVPTCGGTDLLAALQASDPAAYGELVKREQKVLNGKGLLWKVERQGTPTSYIYGTMHMSDKRLTSLPAPVIKALDKADTVALEIGELLDDQKMQQEVIKNIALIAFTDGRTLDTVLSQGEVKTLKIALKKYGMPYNASRIMKPWFVMLSIALPMCEMERQKAGIKALDVTIARHGQNNGAKVVGLETVREQFAAFEALPLIDQKEMLMGSLRMSHMLNDQIETMTKLYLQRRTAALWEFSLYMNKKYTAKGNDAKRREQRAIKQFEKELVIKRNKVMRTRALPLLEKGNLFIAVGALHLPGQNGLVNLLNKSGLLGV